jgi:hypothetical protein
MAALCETMKLNFEITDECTKEALRMLDLYADREDDFQSSNRIASKQPHSLIFFDAWPRPAEGRQGADR